MILHSRGALHARRHVDRERPHGRHHAGDALGREPARDEQALARQVAQPRKPSDVGEIEEFIRRAKAA
jgi:hypothetical protein